MQDDGRPLFLRNSGERPLQLLVLEGGIRFISACNVKGFRRIQVHRRRRNPSQVVDEAVVGNPEEPGLEVTLEAVRHHVGPYQRLLGDVIGKRPVSAQRCQEPPQPPLTRPHFGDEPLPGHSLFAFCELLLLGLHLFGKHLLAGEIDYKEGDAHGHENSAKQIGNDNHFNVIVPVLQML